MEMFKVCRVCLATNIKLYNLHSDSLEFYYELLTGINPLQELNLPMRACFECTALLKKFFLFRQKCLRGQAILQGFFERNEKLTERNLNEIDREKFLLKSSLSVCDPFYLININSELDNNTNMADTIMADEAEPTDYKVEMKYDHDFDVLEEWLSDEEPLYVKKDSEHQEVDLTDHIEFDEPVEEEEVKQEPKKENKRKKELNGLLVKHMNLKENIHNVNIDSYVTKVVLTKEEQIAEFEQRRESESYKTAPVKCEVCLKSFTSYKTLQNHSIRHTKASGRLECDICKLHFKLTDKFKRHKAVHATKYLCNLCPVVSRYLDQAKHHVLWHKGVMYQCPYCDVVRSKWTSFMSHVRIQHPSDHICALCGYSFVSAQGLATHKTKMHRGHAEDIEANSDAPYCEACDVRFASDEAYRRHLVTAKRHVAENPGVGCRECGLKFGSEAERRAHRHTFKRMYRKTTVPYQRKNSTKQSDSLTWPINCPHCSEELTTIRRFTWHFKTKHPNETYPLKREFVCEVCGKAFVSQGLLNFHTRREHDAAQAPATCPTCGKTFASSARLAMHERVTHAATRSHACELCGMAFKVKSALNRHMMVHTGEKRFKCEVCGKAFSQLDGCKVHMRSVHLGERGPPRKRTKRSSKASPSHTKAIYITCPSPDSSDASNASS